MSWMEHYQQRLIELLIDEQLRPADVIAALRADERLAPIRDYLDAMDENQVELAGRSARLWVNKRES